MPRVPHSVSLHRRLFSVATALVAVGLWADAAGAQTARNSGALTVTGTVDIPSVYVFRGLVQEVDPGLTVLPSLDIGVALSSGDGLVKSLGLNLGTWHSFQTGSSGAAGPSKLSHYQENLYSTLNLGLGAGVDVGVTYMALTSPNRMFNTVNELQMRVGRRGWLKPYGFLAFELGEHSADGGERKGSYLELGASPTFEAGVVSLAVPVKVGLSLRDYYELGGQDHRFGYVEFGADATRPISGGGSKFGAWSVHAGARFLMLGETAKAFNDFDKSRTVLVAGLGVSY